jgi:phage replication O-like protein O
MDKPNYTQLPNQVVDVHMRDLNGSELKILLCICRKTIGWHKDADKISISQMVELSGMTEKTVINATKQLENKGIIYANRKSGVTTTYEVISDDTPVKSTVVNRPTPVKSTEATPVIITDTKESSYKESNKESDDSGIDYISFLRAYNDSHDTNLRITDTKRRQIRSRLRTFDKDEILAAIRNRGDDEWVQSHGHASKWDALFRNDEKMEYWLNKSGSSDAEDKISSGIF